MTGVTRRGVLLAAGAAVGATAGGAVLVERDVLPGRARAYSLLGLNGEAAPIPRTAGGPKESGTFASAAQGGRDVGWAVAYPPGSPVDAAIPVAVALHASRGNHETAFTGGLYVDRFLADAVAAGVPPFAVASVDGNGSWLPRGTIDSGRTVVEELLPLLGERGLVTEAWALLGWSAGGLGALVLGASAPGVAAVGVTSPALREGDAAFGARDRYRDGPALRVDCGRGDPFYHAVEDFVSGLHPKPAGGFNDGGHTHSYWRRMLPAQLRFIGGVLARR